MRPIGFSTGALARGDFRKALDLLRANAIQVVELSALRVGELEPLLIAVPDLQLKDFAYVSVHVPSHFDRSREQQVADRLTVVAALGYPLIVHPDVLFTPEIWRRFGPALCIENMDKRKPVGRNVPEMTEMFRQLPDARWCFDIG